MQENDHPPRGADDEEAVVDAMRAVADFARGLQLYGVLILSPVCRHCGRLHEFAVISDLKEGDDVELSTRGGVVASLLRDHAELIESATPERFVTGNKKH